MGKYKKIILIVCIVSLLLVTVCIIPASAVVTNYGYVSIPVLEPQLTGNNTIVELLVTASDGSYHAVMFNFTATPTSLDVPSRFDLAISNVAIKANGIINGDGAGLLSCMMVRDDGYVSYETILNMTDNERDFYFSFGTTSYQNILGYKVYGNFGEVSVDYRVTNQEFNFIYGADNVQFGQLQQIIGAINGLGSISGQINANQNQNTDKITSNQDQNTDEIIQNQEQNTDKILNGGHEEPPYSAPDTSAADEQKELTENIEASTSTGVSTSNNLFAAFNGLFGSDGHIYKGLMSITAIMNEFLGIDFLSPMITFALVLGLFAFLLGMGFFISSAASTARGAHYGKRDISLRNRSYKDAERYPGLEW